MAHPEATEISQLNAAEAPEQTYRLTTVRLQRIFMVFLVSFLEKITFDTQETSVIACDLPILVCNHRIILSGMSSHLTPPFCELKVEQLVYLYSSMAEYEN